MNNTTDPPMSERCRSKALARRGRTVEQTLQSGSASSNTINAAAAPSSSFFASTLPSAAADQTTTATLQQMTNEFPQEVEMVDAGLMLPPLHPANMLEFRNQAFGEVLPQGSMESDFRKVKDYRDFMDLSVVDIVGPKALAGEWEEVSSGYIDVPRDTILHFHGKHCHVVDSQCVIIAEMDEVFGEVTQPVTLGQCCFMYEARVKFVDT